MSPPQLDLEDFRDEIYKRIFDDGDTLQDIVTYLNNEENLIVSLKTIKRRCSKWGFAQRFRDIPLELTEALRMSFFGSHLTDVEIAEELQDVGYRVSARR